MNEQEDIGPTVESLVLARSRPAVLKHNLMNLRGEMPDVTIFVFEGVDDKSIYFSWTMRVRGDLVYEPFVCKGKKRVLALRDAVRRDENDLGRGVHFFVDRDFDGDSIGINEDTFVTDRYAVENYLVCPQVLEELLKIEFHVEAQPAIRRKVIELFESLYLCYLAEMASINERLFIARSLAIDLRKHLPDRIGQFAIVTLNSVQVVASVEDVVLLEREPSLEEVFRQKAQFSQLDPISRYRGKFALFFFNKWLDLLAEDRCSQSSVLFVDLPKNVKINRQEMSLMALAARSKMPLHFAEFIKGIAA